MHIKNKEKYQQIKKLFITSLPIIVFALLVVFIIIGAWLCDDAYISFRVVKNFVNGYGLRWNTFERVQVFTNPLMVFLMIPLYAIFKNVYYTSMILNMVTSILAIYLLVFKINKNKIFGSIICILLLLSESFLSFTTSGLENSLTFLLLAIFYYFFLKKDTYGKKDILLITFIASIILFNRLDTILLVFPSLIYMFFKKEKNVGFFKFCLLFIIGMIPFILWEMFSLVYYGFLFPNTYYVKISNGLVKSVYIKQGFKYLYQIFKMDYVTVATILFSIVLSIKIIKKDKHYIGLFVGIILTIMYIVSVGGDFMYGRFLTAPLFVSIIGLCALDVSAYKNIFTSAFVGISIILFINSKLYSHSLLTFDYDSTNGIANEKLVYYDKTSLIYVGNEEIIKNYAAIYHGNILENVYTDHNIGFFGYFVKSDDIIIDTIALSDPLIARVPLKNAELTRIGHIMKDIPNGYPETLAYGKNVIENKDLNEYYDKLKIITQGNIFSKERFKTIILMNLGKYDYLLEDFATWRNGFHFYYHYDENGNVIMD